MSEFSGVVAGCLVGIVVSLCMICKALQDIARELAILTKPDKGASK